MQLYLDSYGAYLSVRDGAFNVRLRLGDGSQQDRLFAVRQVQAILLTKGTALSADAALLAAGHDIPVLLIDAHTHYPLAQIGSGRPGSIAAVRRGQALWSLQAGGFAWVSGLLARKVEGQRALLRQLGQGTGAPPGFAQDLASTDRVLAALEKELRQWRAPAQPEDWNKVKEETAARFRGQEGTASRLYFQRLGQYLAPRLAFAGRQKRPAFDPFNALLNYLYGMLYTQVHLALLKSGLDPHMGVLHADQYGARPTLVFDAIEPYRPWADRVAVQLVESGALGPEAFVEEEGTGALRLQGAGKGAAVEAMLDLLQTPAEYEGKKVRRSARIDLEAQKLAVFLKDFSA